MKKRPYRIGNCPECHLCVTCVSNGKTPRHGHIKTNIRGYTEWLPPCSGSGKPAIYVQTVGKGEE